MNKKAQAGPIGFILIILILLANWAIWLGKYLNDMGNSIIVQNNITGVEAFFYAYLNVWFFLILLLGVMGYMYWIGAAR